MDTALDNGFVEVGWMHIDVHSSLLSEDAFNCFKEGECAYLYVNPNEIADAERIVLWIDEKENILLKK